MLSEELMFQRRALMAQKAQSDALYEAWNLSFDGTNYIDTGVYLFEDDVKNRDFEFIAEGIYGDNTSGSETIICAKHNLWNNGFLIRTTGNTSTAYKGTIHVMKNVKCNVIVKRINGHITLTGTNIANPTVQFNDGGGHHWSLHLGCAIDDDGNRYRYAAGTIDHIVVRWL